MSLLTISILRIGARNRFEANHAQRMELGWDKRDCLQKIQ
jgi:hypothetical protein